MKKNNGFTLVEMLMVVFLFGLIMTLSGALFSAVLKGSSKSEITKEVKQIGDYAMGQMERAIRNAKTVICPTGGKIVTITDRNANSFSFECTEVILADGVQITSIASTSGILTGRLTGDNVTLNQSQSGDCNSSSLIFSCNYLANPPQVTINFSLFQKGTSSRPEDQASVNFQSTINLRTY